jgi:hypothetical protein
MSIYVGPYIRCTVDQVTPPKEIRSCSSEICHLLLERKEFTEAQRFCTACGSPAATVTVLDDEQDSVSWWALNEGTNERLCMFNGDYNSPGVHISIPNQDWPRGFNSSLECRELSVQADMIRQETAWFETAFEKGIALARELYGADRVEIRWGVLGRY